MIVDRGETVTDVEQVPQNLMLKEHFMISNTEHGTTLYSLLKKHKQR